MKVGQYVIRRQDWRAAIVFIEQQLDQEPLWTGESHALAKQEYLNISADPEGINAWCGKWLNDEQWEQLRQAISTARTLQENVTQIRPLKTINLSYHAWQILVDLAQRDNTSPSNAIINHLGKIYFASNTQAEPDHGCDNLNHDNQALNT